MKKKTLYVQLIQFFSSVFGPRLVESTGVKLAGTERADHTENLIACGSNIYMQMSSYRHAIIIGKYFVNPGEENGTSGLRIRGGTEPLKT